MRYYNNNRGPDRIRSLLKTALREYEPKPVDSIKAGESDKRLDRTRPRGTVLVRVNSKVLGGYPPAGNARQEIFQNSISRDNLWILENEQREMAQGEIPTSLALRIARFHCVDNTRGEPPMWRRSEVSLAKLQLDERGRLTGEIRLESKDKRRGYDAEVIGFVHFQQNQLTKFDVVIKGQFWGEGRYTKGAPKGKFPLAIAFRQADMTNVSDQVAPQGTKGWIDGYLDPGAE